MCAQRILNTHSGTLCADDPRATWRHPMSLWQMLGLVLFAVAAGLVLALVAVGIKLAVEKLRRR
jgi:hypothetical protein